MDNRTKLKVSIVGATGYTGSELLRLLVGHPYVEVREVTSRQEAGKLISDFFPSLRNYYDIAFVHPDNAKLEDSDLVFFATPNGVAMKSVSFLLESGVKVIDLSADFRIQDIFTWEKWYKQKHSCPHYIPEAVYGLVEMNRKKIQSSRLIANPGCYSTAVILALLPLLDQKLLDHHHSVIADCKSGVSGAGRKESIAHLLCEAGENFKSYGLAGHRHIPEIKAVIESRDEKILDQLVFVPHLLPMIRGMQATVYVHLKDNTQNLLEIYQEYYQSSNFVDVLPSGHVPETKDVKGSNKCRLAVHKAPDSDVFIILSVIDNLVKGAAGQAIQNMNVMFDFSESTGLDLVPLIP